MWHTVCHMLRVLWRINYFSIWNIWNLIRIYCDSTQYPWTSDKPIFVCLSISHWKLKVLECSTGKDKVEEWTCLPANWDHVLVRRPFFDENFAFLDFETWGNFEFTDTGDILVLNLVTRTKFWMRFGTLTTQVKEKAAGRIDLADFWAQKAGGSRLGQMTVERDRILINYVILCFGYTLGWFSDS